ncbi:MAG: type II toxin-antitoxin system VapC family toxin [Armatimonadota bacterium]
MGPLGGALEGCTLIGLDTELLIYMFEQNPRYVPLCRPLVERYEDPRDPLHAVASAVALTEVLVLPFRDDDARLVDTYTQNLTNQRGLTVVPIGADIAVCAAQLRARYRLKTPDAIHLATAVQTGCDAFITNDQDFRGDPETEIRILFLDDYV